MNFLIKVQPFPKMKQNRGRAGAALNTAKKKEKTLLQYKAAPLAQNQKKKTQSL